MHTQSLNGFVETGRGLFAVSASSPARDAWHSAAFRDATTVRRLLRGTAGGGLGVKGQGSTMDALEQRAVSELLLTPRFVELHPDAALQATRLAAKHGAKSTTISGLAAFELDLASGGIGAILRRPNSQSHDNPRVA